MTKRLFEQTLMTLFMEHREGTLRSPLRRTQWRSMDSTLHLRPLKGGPAAREKPCTAITVDDNLNCNRQPPRHAHTHIHFVSFLHSEYTPLHGCHSNPKANNIVPEVEEARAENRPNHIRPALRKVLITGVLLYLPSDTERSAPPTPPHLPSHPPPGSEERQHYKSIYKL